MVKMKKNMLSLREEKMFIKILENIKILEEINIRIMIGIEKEDIKEKKGIIEKAAEKITEEIFIEVKLNTEKNMMDIETNTMIVEDVEMIEVIELIEVIEVIEMIEVINMIHTEIEKDIAVKETITIKKKTVEIMVRVAEIMIEIIEIRIDTAVEEKTA
jgi:hypothetical protein